MRLAASGGSRDRRRERPRSLQVRPTAGSAHEDHGCVVMAVPRDPGALDCRRCGRDCVGINWSVVLGARRSPWSRRSATWAQRCLTLAVASGSPAGACLGRPAAARVFGSCPTTVGKKSLKDLLGLSLYHQRFLVNDTPGALRAWPCPLGPSPDWSWCRLGSRCGFKPVSGPQERRHTMTLTRHRLVLRRAGAAPPAGGHEEQDVTGPRPSRLHPPGP
jgi:hypothetical protein